MDLGICLKHGQVEITPSKTIKYLGIWRDAKLSVEDHDKKTKERAKTYLAAILRLMSNVGELGCAIRVTLCGVKQSIVLNGAPVLSIALKMTKYTERLLSL